MAKACHPVHAQLWLRPPSLELVKLTARPPPLVEQGKRRSSLDRWFVQKEREHNCNFLIPRHLAGQDDTWPAELRDWPNKVTKWNSNKTDIAQNRWLRCWYQFWYTVEVCCNLWTGCDAGKKFDGGRRLGQGQWYGVLQQSGCTPYSTAVARTCKVSTVPVAICCLLWLVLFVYIFLLPLPAASCRFQTLWHYAKKPFWTSLLSQSCYVSLWTMLNFILFHQSAIHIQLLGIVSQIGFLWLMLVSKIYTALQSSSRQCQSLTCKSSVHACTTASRLSFVCRDCFNCMTLSVKHASTCALHKVH